MRHLEVEDQGDFTHLSRKAWEVIKRLESSGK